MIIHNYSGKTLSALIRFLAASFTSAELGELFLFVSAHEFDTADQFAGKLEKTRRVIMALTSQGELAKIEELLDEVIKRRKSLFEAASSSISSTHDAAPDRPERELLRALKIDGYEFENGKIVPSENLEPELQEEINVLYERLQSINAQDVCSNLEQADENFVHGNYEACNAMLRTALESTLKHIATRQAGKLDNVPKSNPKWSEPTPNDVRQFLRNQGFLTDDEHKFIAAFYGYVSPKGSHPGISSSAESRLRRLMIVALIQYCLEKFTAKYV